MPSPYLPEIERLRGDLTLQRIRVGWTVWRGRAVEPLLRESLARLLPDQTLPAAPAIGGYWNRSNTIEIDIVGADREPIARQLHFLGSIKWLDRMVQKNSSPPGHNSRATIVGRPGWGWQVFDWILGSITGVAALFFGLLWAAWSWDALRWLRLRRTGTPTTGVVISQTESDAGRSTRIRFTAGGIGYEFLTDGMGNAGPGDVVPVRYDPRRPRRAVYPGGAGQTAVKLVSLVLLPAAFPGVLLITMPDTGVIQILTVLGFMAGAILGGWLRSRPTRPAKPARAAPRWLVWWSDHQGDVSVLGLVIVVPVVAWISGDPPWRMPIPLLLGAVVVPYLMTRWLTRGWRELVAGMVFTLLGIIGVAIGSRTDADPQLTWQALCAAIAGLVIAGIGLYRIPRPQGNTPPPVPDHPSPAVQPARVTERGASHTSPDHILRPAVPAPLHSSSPSAQQRPVEPADQPPRPA